MGIHVVIINVYCNFATLVYLAYSVCLQYIMHLLHMFWKEAPIFTYSNQDVRTQDVVYSTDCEAPWGKFVICYIWLYK